MKRPVRPDVLAVGVANNAVIESFWSRMQVELLDRQKWRTRVELANAIFEYSRSFTTGSVATLRLACCLQPSSKPDTDQRQRHESSEPPPRNPGQPRASSQFVARETGLAPRFNRGATNNSLLTGPPVEDPQT